MNHDPLTAETLQQALTSLMLRSDEVIALKPTKLMVPPSVYRYLMWQPPLPRVQGIRKRKRALSHRPRPALWVMMRSMA
jgi:hypothetical protein